MSSWGNKDLPSGDAIVFVDIASEHVRIVQRTGPHPWQEEAHAEPVDIGLSALELTLPHGEVVAGD